MKIKKKTYVIDANFVHKLFYDYHSGLDEMPLPILSINKEILKREGCLIPTGLFPNPNAAEMISDFINERDSLHTRLSLTIVEYYNIKNKPLAYLFPNGSVFYTTTRPNTRIRKALKNDLVYQIAIRQQLIEHSK